MLLINASEGGLEVRLELDQSQRGTVLFTES